MHLTLVDSFCGFERKIPTIDGKQISFSRYGPIAPGSKETFPGLGLPDSKNPTRRGDMIVNYEVDYPKTTLGEKQRTMLRKIFSEDFVSEEPEAPEEQEE